MPTNDLPEPVPGPTLAETRRKAGVSQTGLARRLGIHRISLVRWEKAAPLDGIRVAKYQRALDELVDEALA